MGRTSGRLLAVAIGVIGGLIVLAAFASRLGLVGSPGVPTPSAAAKPPPSPLSSATQITSLSALAGGEGPKSGDEVELRLSEESLNQDLTTYLQQNVQGVTISNAKVHLLPGQVILTGSASQGILATDFTITTHPAIQNGQLVLVIDSIEPALVEQFSSTKVGQTIELAPNLNARSVTVSSGLMVVAGTVK
jgi:hypothetical protein